MDPLFQRRKPAAPGMFYGTSTTGKILKPPRKSPATALGKFSDGEVNPERLDITVTGYPVWLFVWVTMGFY